MLNHNRLVSFEPTDGRLTCEAGVLLRDVLDVFVPRGWYPAVVPGTKFVTIGGMVAADVHGKNHHLAGSFGRYVESLTLLQANGSIITCSQEENGELFRATIGGMGLTGVILTVAFRLLPIETSYIRQETLQACDLHQVMDLFIDSAEWTYTVAWIDCLATSAAGGRSLLFRGEHAALADLCEEIRANPLRTPARHSMRVPLDLPGALLNRTTARGFNSFYYRRGSRTGDTKLVNQDSFFFPLDRLLEWNRIYGRKGFTQYQCVLPKPASRDGIAALLAAISRSGQSPFLSVLKLLGPQDGLLSFPMEGYTLALDFPLRVGTLELLDRLDEIVAHHGGRVYLAKDARMSAKRMRDGYPELHRFEKLRADAGAGHRFQSLLSRRLML
jgi:FAD/FMN-containing dehydrogenase